MRNLIGNLIETVQLLLISLCEKVGIVLNVSWGKALALCFGISAGSWKNGSFQWRNKVNQSYDSSFVDL